MGNELTVRTKNDDNKMENIINTLKEQIALLEIQLENERKIVEAVKINNELLKVSLNAMKGLYGGLGTQTRPTKRDWNFIEN